METNVMSEETKAKLLNWVYENHDHHDHEDILVKGKEGQVGSEYTEKWADCTDAEYPYVNSLALEEFIKSL